MGGDERTVVRPIRRSQVPEGDCKRHSSEALRSYLPTTGCLKRVLVVIAVWVVRIIRLPEYEQDRGPGKTV